MLNGRLHKTSAIKRGAGQRIFLAFGGRRHRSEPKNLPAKTDLRAEFLGMLLLAMFASMILIVLWRYLSVAH